MSLITYKASKGVLENDSYHRNSNKLVVAWALVPHRICWHNFDVIPQAVHDNSANISVCGTGAHATYN